MLRNISVKINNIKIGTMDDSDIIFMVLYYKYGVLDMLLCL